MKKKKKERFPLAENIPKITPPCPRAPICGGCNFLDISYEDEKKHKEGMILSSLGSIKDFYQWASTFEGLIGATNILEYRNKLEFTFGDNGEAGQLELGLRKKGLFYEVINGSVCCLGDGDFRLIMKESLAFFTQTDQFFHPFRDHGALKNLIVRKGFHTGEILIMLVASSGVLADLAAWVGMINALPLEGEVVGVLLITDNKTSGGIVPEQIDILYGRDYYIERIMGLDFQVSPFSFFQTNTQGASKLYTTVKEYVAEYGGDLPIIFDLYCGTGTIAQILSPVAREVYGIDIVPEAIDMATKNAKANQLSNCFFIPGDIRQVLSALPTNPDIIVVDPPREGLHPKLIEPLLQLNPRLIVYVSCNPHTLAIDLGGILAGGYKVIKFIGHDLFPQTKHVETVVLLER